MSKAIAIVTAIISIGLMIASGFAGYQYSESQNAKNVAALNKTIYDLGVVVQNETNRQAETNRQLKVANRDRINAIKINDHNTDTINELQKRLDISIKELETVSNKYNYIVLDINTIDRVYDEARNNCYGLPDANDSPIISAKLSEFTGDSIAGVVRYTVARYCEVATDYNNLYSDTEKLLAQ